MQTTSTQVAKLKEEDLPSIAALLLDIFPEAQGNLGIYCYELYETALGITLLGCKHDSQSTDKNHWMNEGITLGIFPNTWNLDHTSYMRLSFPLPIMRQHPRVPIPTPFEPPTFLLSLEKTFESSIEKITEFLQKTCRGYPELDKTATARTKKSEAEKRQYQLFLLSRLHAALLRIQRYRKAHY